MQKFMADEKEQVNTTKGTPNAPKEGEKREFPRRSPGSRGPGGGRGGGRGGKGGRGGGRGGPRGGERFRPEFDQKLLTVRRVARVVSGGRRFSFAVALVAGNKKGKAGVGTGKASDTALAIEKAFNNARKNMATIRTTDTMSIPHEVSAKYSSARVSLRPAPGRGLVAGSSVRSVLLLAGLTDVSGKLVSRTKNQLNNARATLKALGMLRPARKKAADNPLPPPAGGPPSKKVEEK